MVPAAGRLKRLRILLRAASALLGRDRRWRWALLTAAGALLAALEAVGALLIYSLLSVIADQGAPQLPVLGDLQSRFPGVDERTLQLVMSGVVVTFFVVRAALISLQGYVRARVMQNAAADLSIRMVSGYMSMPYLFHTGHNSSELIRNAFNSPQLFMSAVINSLLVLIAELLMIGALATVLLLLAPEALLLAAIFFSTVILILLRILQPRVQAVGREAQDAIAASIKALQEAFDGYRDIRLLRREAEFVETYAQRRRAFARTEYLRVTFSELPRAVIETSLVVIVVALFALLLVTGTSEGTIVSTLGVFAYAGLRLQPSLQKVVHALNELRYGTAVLTDLAQHYEEAQAVSTVGDDRRWYSDEVQGPATSIELKGISFAYQAGGELVLDSVDLEITRGSFVGVCGPTGSGKSTLMDVVIGLLEPTSGDVLVDGRPLQLQMDWWHRQLGVVSQNIFLADVSLRANIALGEDPALVSPDRLERAVRRAQLADVVAALPDGLETVVGERGIRLSGGQRQRVAIARALYREPAVVILDEGTSALDAATEEAFVTALAELQEGRTLLAVAHRISTVQRADKIIVMNAGVVEAVGDYSSLLKTSALFRSLAQ